MGAGGDYFLKGYIRIEEVKKTLLRFLSKRRRKVKRGKLLCMLSDMSCTVSEWSYGLRIPSLGINRETEEGSKSLSCSLQKDRPRA